MTQTSIPAPLAGRVALVTGGTRGIGAASARALARHGADVLVTYARSADDAQALTKQIASESPVRALAVQADAADSQSVVDAVETTVRELGRLDILVNNAGAWARAELEDVTVQDVDHVLTVNLRSTFLASQAAARHMGEGGRIITIGTCLVEKVPGPGMTLFSMSKSALTGMTKGLARDLGPRGITATLIHPGPIDTDTNPADAPHAPYFRQATALGRYGTVDEVAATVVHLAGESGRYITGTAISVDGGFAA